LLTVINFPFRKRNKKRTTNRRCRSPKSQTGSPILARFCANFVGNFPHEQGERESFAARSSPTRGGMFVAAVRGSCEATG
jgi:hypothetical protein